MFIAWHLFASKVEFVVRDVQVDRNFLSAWTLLGHEFIELRQHEAAIEAYRQAVDVRSCQPAQ